jgi:hypothetical protein
MLNPPRLKWTTVPSLGWSSRYMLAVRIRKWGKLSSTLELRNVSENGRRSPLQANTLFPSWVGDRGIRGSIITCIKWRFRAASMSTSVQRYAEMHISESKVCMHGKYSKKDHILAFYLDASFTQRLRSGYELVMVFVWHRRSKLQIRAKAALVFIMP